MTDEKTEARGSSLICSSDDSIRQIQLQLHLPLESCALWCLHREDLNAAGQREGGPIKEMSQRTLSGEETSQAHSF